MDLSENRTNHRNLIQSVADNACIIGQIEHTNSIIIPSNGEVTAIDVKTVTELEASTIEQLCQFEPEVIILATGSQIDFPDPDMLTPLIEKNIGLEVLTNQAAARTFNVLLSEDRQAVCLMLM
ncbi:MTH938/NDUFAF3 family protein [Marinicella sp. S1101]|uniref:Mth938-like domain-containing protein n=1 Tax=Marinicella marina TaxID=2996016 RepID=UPI002260E59F|nr:MTH938/NDUFAF3 family protein [Marinicella marina]MCX7553963.1 MTH938/NDUFAF3 family protein [Marinicella marina]MDJ1140455.1 MTH938/NDUFAF3 family protein [Marinicella marina]